MSQDRENASVEGDNKDRISALPGNIIDHILELLPAQDAAKTSVLSKKWRYIWRKLPYLVLDYHFVHFCSKFRGKSKSFFKQTVDGILSNHVGDIVKFVLYITEEQLCVDRWSSYEDVDRLYEDVDGLDEDADRLYEDVDRWMRHVTRNGIKKLTLYAPEDEVIYELPSSLFNCATLTCLELCYCVFKPPNSFLNFPKLETLHLEGIKIVPTTEFCVLNVPLLVNLDLMHCDGTQYLHIVSPLLEVLGVYEIHYLVLNYFMNCKKLRELHLSFFNMVGNMNHDERATVEMFLVSLAPTLEKLDLTASILELLSAGAIPKGPLLMLNCLRYISSIVDLGKFSQTSGILQLITSVPNLSKLEISVDGTNDSVNAVKKYKKYLSTPACPNQLLINLKHVIIRWFRCSKIELLFIKLLVARTPSLVRVSIEYVTPGSSEERSIITAFGSFPRASPNAELYFPPN